MGSARGSWADDCPPAPAQRCLLLWRKILEPGLPWDWRGSVAGWDLSIPITDADAPCSWWFANDCGQPREDEQWGFFYLSTASRLRWRNGVVGSE